MRLPRLASFALLGLTLIPSLAFADPSAEDSERANALFKKGKAAYSENRIQDAYRLYNEAWSLKQSPDIAANLAQTEADLKMAKAAAEHFAFALDHLLPSSTEEQKKALSEGLEAEKKEIGTLRMTLEPPDAAVTIDGAAAKLRTGGEVYVEPGEHKCAASRDGFQPNEQTVQVSKGGSQVLWIKLKPTVSAGLGDALPAAGTTGTGPAPAGETAPATTQPATPDAPHDTGGSHARSLVPAFIGGGIAVVGLGAGIGFTLSGNSHSDKAKTISNSIPGDNGCGTGTAFASQCADLKSQNDSKASARTLETVSFVVAGVAAVGTAVYLLWPTDHANASSTALVPGFGVAPGVGSVSLSGRF